VDDFKQCHYEIVGSLLDGHVEILLGPPSELIVPRQELLDELFKIGHLKPKVKMNRSRTVQAVGASVRKDKLLSDPKFITCGKYQLSEIIRFYF